MQLREAAFDLRDQKVEQSLHVLEEALHTLGIEVCKHEQ
jgi:hypothetical protein